MTGRVVVLRGDASPTRPALRWFGGKWRLASWIIQHLPRHDAYCEPYGGAASVLLRKPPAKLETWNDLHGRLVNFFTVLRERPAELVRLLELTPYARAEYDLAHHQATDPLEDARRFFVLSWQGRVGAAGDTDLSRRTSGWRYTIDIAGRNGCGPADEFADLAHLLVVAARLSHVQIEHAPALTVIGRYDRSEVLHYVDPPYHDPTADLHARYAHPMTETDHSDLADALHQAAGMVVLSGRPSALYDQLYGDWPQVQRESLTDAGTLGAEVLWLNPAAAAALNRTRPRQGRLL
jgi:DNA adenine methylase